MRVRPGSLVPRALAAMTLLSSVAWGCASGGTPPTIGEAYGALTAESAIGQFLDAANRQDYAVMRRLFGTVEGPAERRFGRVEVEQRMHVLAGLLRHQSYGLRPTGFTEAEGKTRVLADLVGTRNGSVTVPIVAASNRGRWFVEQIVTDQLTSG